MGESRRLDDAAVQRLLVRLDELLDQIEQVPGPTAESALEAVRTLTAVYGEAMARTLEAAGPELAEAFCADELLNHLLVLHSLHPGSVTDRVERALERVRPAVERKGGRIELAHVDSEVATVRLLSGGCGSCSPQEVEQAVSESVLALAPELTRVETVEQTPGEDAPSLIPVEALLTRTGAAAGRNP